jgi:extradiol dioxygenase family protein
MAKSKQAPAAVEEFRQRPLFHLAFRVNDLEATRNFYVDVLGCRVGRSSDTWIDFDFFGYQISAHCLGKGVPSHRPTKSMATTSRSRTSGSS